MFASLMTSRRFAPLFWCQFFSAFNDNFVRQMLALLILFRLDQGGGALVTLAVALLVVPSFFLSGLGGELADSHDKAICARRMKFAELFVQAVAAAGFYFSSLTLLFAALFGLGVIAALFGPIKYGILPDHLETRELPTGNALVEAATFLAVLSGLIVGGYAADQGRDPANVVVQMMIVALLCWGSSRLIPPTGAAAPKLRIDPNILASTVRLVRDLRGEQRLWIGGIVVSWFWMTGAVALSLVPVVIKTRIGGGIDVETGISALFAVGIGAGSVAAAIIAGGRIRLLPVPFAGIVMGLLLLDLGISTLGMPAATTAVPLAVFLTTSHGLRVAADVMGIAAAGGIFVVPTFAAVQSWAGEERRARVVAGINVVTSFAIVGGTIVTAVLQAVRVDESVLLVMLGVINLLFVAWLFARLPGNLPAEALNAVFRLAFRMEVQGREHIRAAGPRCVIAVNHLSFLDAPVIFSVIEEAPAFAIDETIAKAWWVRPFLRFARCFPLDPRKPLATRAMIRVVEAGQQLVIFPEGRLTVTGSLMKVYDGTALIADKANAMVVPVRLEGLERTHFSKLSRSQVRRALFPKVRVTFLPPRRLTIPAGASGRQRRNLAGAALYDTMSTLIFETTPIDRTLTRKLKLAIRDAGSGRVLVEDAMSGRMTGRDVLLGAAVLSRKIMQMGSAGDSVGLLMPNVNATAVTFFAIQSAQRVVALLNYTAGEMNLLSACRMARIRHLITSRAFVEKAGLGETVAALAREVTIHYLEDLRGTITLADKLRGAVDMIFGSDMRPADSPAVILFTSGSEGAPKGVVLSHRNLIANVEQIAALFDISPGDIIFNALPVFHAFGLTGGMLLGLLTGTRVYLYPSPLHYRQIPEVIYTTNATVLFGTDTFLAGYARMANAYDLRSLRYIVAGAERVKDETRKRFMEKFGQRILEGYGVTEAAPVLAVNTPMFNRIGTVGRLLPGIEYRLESVPGISEGGRLVVRGPNVMIGYLRQDNPGMIEETAGGWYDTGDIVTIDVEGFVTIVGRARRFAKIAGEMISLAAVERFCSDLWPESPLAVVAVPDPRKGERLVLVTTNAQANREDMHRFIREQGGTELMVPHDILIVETLPLLASGKTDLAALGRLVDDSVDRPATVGPTPAGSD